MRITVTTDQRRCVRRQPVGNKAHPLIGQQLARRGPFAAEDQYPLQIFLPGQRRTQPFPDSGVLYQQHLHRRVGHDVGNIVRPVIGIQRHRHQPAGQRGLVKVHPFLAVAQVYRDALAGQQVLGGQRRLPAGYLFTHFAPTGIAPRLAVGIKVAVGNNFRRALDTLQHQAIQRPGLLGGNNIFGSKRHKPLFPLVMTKTGRLR